MTIEQSRRAQRAQPFRAHALKLASGQTIRVKSPEFVAESESGRTIAVHDGDAFEIIDLSLVEGVEVGNGRRRQGSRKCGRQWSATMTLIHAICETASFVRARWWHKGCEVEFDPAVLISGRPAARAVPGVRQLIASRLGPVTVGLAPMTPASGTTYHLWSCGGSA